jgi:hypothetical protein
MKIGGIDKNEELMQLFEDVGVATFVRKIILNFIGNIYGIDSRSKVS